MDAMFYIQASTKQQASYIFSTLSPKPTANCQLTDLQNETVVPSISPISLSLNPWSINSQSRTRELSMATHGLNLICAVTDEHTRQIVDFCDNLGQQLKDPDDKSAWVKLINSECALLNSPRLYPVLLEPETPAQFEIFVPAPEDGDHDTVIASVVEECFGDECRYRATDKAFAMSEKPIIRLEAHFNDKREKVLELTFSSFNLSLSASVYEHQLRHISLLCDDFGVRLQGRAGASCHINMRSAYRRLAHVGTGSRPGDGSDVRGYTSSKEQKDVKGLLDKSTRGSELVPARHGQQFNGVLVNATPAPATTGFIYLSHDFPEGQFMMTAEVLHVGITPGGIYYIETLDGYRFIVTAFEKGLMNGLREFLAVNEDYFKYYRWS